MTDPMPIYTIDQINLTDGIVTMWIRHNYSRRRIGITFSLQNFLSKTLIIKPQQETK